MDWSTWGEMFAAMLGWTWGDLLSGGRGKWGENSHVGKSNMNLHYPAKPEWPSGLQGPATQTVVGSSPGLNLNQCLQMYLQYVDQKDLAAMLTSIQSAGVASEWIWGICCVQARKHTSEGFTLALKSRADITRSPKQGYQWPHERELCSPKI